MLKGLQRLKSLVGVVDEDLAYQVDCFTRLLLFWEDFVQASWFNLWELEFGVVWVHGVDLVTRRSAQNFYNFY